MTSGRAVHRAGIGEPVAQGRHLWFVTRKPLRRRSRPPRRTGDLADRRDRPRHPKGHRGRVRSSAPQGTGPYALTALGRRVSFFVSGDECMTLYLSDGSRAGTKSVGYWFNPASPYCYHGTLALRSRPLCGLQPGAPPERRHTEGDLVSPSRAPSPERSCPVSWDSAAGSTSSSSGGGWRWWRLQHESTALWRTDGTRRGTAEDHRLRPRAGGADPTHLRERSPLLLVPRAIPGSRAVDQRRHGGRHPAPDRHPAGASGLHAARVRADAPRRLVQRRRRDPWAGALDDRRDRVRDTPAPRHPRPVAAVPTRRAASASATGCSSPPRMGAMVASSG